MQLRSYVFSQVTGLSGDYDSLMSVGITTGKDFDPKATTKIELDEAKFREALRKDRSNVQGLFSSTAGNGIADTMFTYVDSLTSYNGFLNQRTKASGSIDSQIKMFNDQIARINDRAALHETRLKRQFSAMEQMMSNYKSQGESLSGMPNFS